MNSTRLRLGEVLVNSGLLSEEKLNAALDIQKERQLRLGTILLQEGFVSENNLLQALSRHLSIPWVSIWRIDVPDAVVRLVPVNVAEEFFLFPIYIRTEKDGTQALYVAMNDPSDEDAMRFVTASAGMIVKPMIAAPSDIAVAIRYYYYNEEAVWEDEAGESAKQETANAPSAGMITSDGGIEDLSSEIDKVSIIPTIEVKEDTTEQIAPPVHLEGDEVTRDGAGEQEASGDDGADASQAQTESAPNNEDSVFANKQSAQREAERRLYGVGRKKASNKFALTLLDGTTLSFGAGENKEDTSESQQCDVSEEEFLRMLKSAAIGDFTDSPLPSSNWQVYLVSLVELLLKKNLVQYEELYELIYKSENK